jgi:hypothetical protein
MPGKNLPYFDSLAQGLDYANATPPDDDSCSLEGTDQNGVLGAPNSQPAPLQGVSLATKKVNAPGNGQTWNSGDKGTNWMGGSTLPWER